RTGARRGQARLAASAKARRVEHPRGVVARSSLRRKVMLPLKDRPLRAKASASESLTPHDSAALSKKRVDYGVFLPCYRLSVPDNPGFVEFARAGKRASARAKSHPSSQEQIWAFGLSFDLAPLGGEIGGRETVAELGMANLAVTRGFDHGPGLGIGEQGLGHQRIEPRP